MPWRRTMPTLLPRLRANVAHALRQGRRRSSDGIDRKSRYLIKVDLIKVAQTGADRHAAAGTKHSTHFRQSAVRLGYMEDAIAANDGIEPIIGIWQILRVPLATTEGAFRRAASTMASEKSTDDTFAPRSVAASASTPCPVQTSSTSHPRMTPAASSVTSTDCAVSGPKTASFPSLLDCGRQTRRCFKTTGRRRRSAPTTVVSPLVV